MDHKLFSTDIQEFKSLRFKVMMEQWLRLQTHFSLYMTFEISTFNTLKLTAIQCNLTFNLNQLA